MLLGDDEREQLLELLSRHAADGRLELGELERRVARVLEAGTREEAVAVLADLPPLPTVRRRTSRIGGRRGHGDADTPAPGWTPTSERFRDPRSGTIMRVWVDAGGGRHYVPDA